MDVELDLYQVTSPLGATALCLASGPAEACAMARAINHGPDGKPFNVPDDHLGVCLLEVDLDAAGVLWWA